MTQYIKKEAILKSAESLFYNHGFHAVGMKKIIENYDGIQPFCFEGTIN